MKFLCTNAHPALCFQHRNPRGEPRRVVVVRSTFDIAPDGTLTPCSPAPPLNFREQSFGDITATPPRFESDLAPEKAKIDLIVHASAHAPGGRPAPRFDVAMAIREPGSGHGSGPLLCERRITVTGPREWRYRPLVGWTLSDPEPVLEVPLRFDYAYGGTVRLDEPSMGLPRPVLLAHPDNPVGRGFVPDAARVCSEYGIDRSDAQTLVSEWARRVERVPAPQLERPGLPLRSVHEPYPLVGWGLVAKHWGPRYRHAGTFDEAWRAARHPLLPLDFDTHYWNGAHPELQLASVPEGAVIELLNLVPTARASHQALRIRLPRLRPVLKVRHVRGPGPAVVPMRLDTILIDLTSDQLTVLHRFDMHDDPTLVYVHLEVLDA